MATEETLTKTWQVTLNGATLAIVETVAHIGERTAVEVLSGPAVKRTVLSGCPDVLDAKGNWNTKIIKRVESA